MVDQLFGQPPHRKEETEGPKPRKGKPPRRNRIRAQLDCTKDNECYNGQYCAQDVHKCFDELNAKYKEACLRDGGTCFLVACFHAGFFKLFYFYEVFFVKIIF